MYSFQIYVFLYCFSLLWYIQFLYCSHVHYWNLHFIIYVCITMKWFNEDIATQINIKKNSFKGFFLRNIQWNKIIDILNSSQIPLIRYYAHLQTSCLLLLFLINNPLKPASASHTCIDVRLPTEHGKPTAFHSLKTEWLLLLQ